MRFSIICIILILNAITSLGAADANKRATTLREIDQASEASREARPGDTSATTQPDVDHGHPPAPTPAGETHRLTKEYIALCTELERAHNEEQAGVLFDMAEAAYDTLCRRARIHGTRAPACEHRIDAPTIVDLERPLSPSERVQIRRYRRAQIDKACATVAW